MKGAKARNRLERRRKAYDSTAAAAAAGFKRPGSFKKPMPRGRR